MLQEQRLEKYLDQKATCRPGHAQPCPVEQACARLVFGETMCLYKRTTIGNYVSGQQTCFRVRARSATSVIEAQSAITAIRRYTPNTGAIRSSSRAQFVLIVWDKFKASAAHCAHCCNWGPIGDWPLVLSPTCGTFSHHHDVSGRPESRMHPGDKDL